VNGGRFRITATPSTDKGLRLVCEFFDDRKDADEFYRQLQQPDTILSGAGYGACIIAIDELSNGDWTNANTKLITFGGE